MSDLNKTKISNHQLMAITTAFICGASTIIISSSAASLAERDAWISAIISIPVGAIFIWMNTYLGKLYPDKTYVEVMQLLLGKWLGGLIAVNFILMCLTGTSEFVWYVSDFLTTQFMPETPVYIINLLFIIAVVIALLYGIEAIARASEMFFYVIIVMFTFSMLFVSPKVDMDNMLPILEKGMTPVLKGSLQLLSFTVLPGIILNMVYPVNVKVIKAAKKSMFKGYLVGMTITFVSVMMCNLVLGSTMTSISRFPVFLLSKEIDIGIIFTRLEALIVIVWLLTIFNNTVFFFYGGALGLAQLLKLKQHQKIVLPLGLIIFVLSDTAYKDVIYELTWDTEVWPPYIISLSIVLPVLLLLVTFVKKLLAKK